MENQKKVEEMTDIELGLNHAQQRDIFENAKQNMQILLMEMMTRQQRRVTVENELNDDKTDKQV